MSWTIPKTHHTSQKRLNTMLKTFFARGCFAVCVTLVILKALAAVKSDVTVIVITVVTAVVTTIVSRLLLSKSRPSAALARPVTTYLSYENNLGWPGWMESISSEVGFRSASNVTLERARTVPS